MYWNLKGITLYGVVDSDRFARKWNFDDITKGEPLTATEDEALKPVLENTVGKDFNSQIID